MNFENRKRKNEYRPEPKLSRLDDDEREAAARHGNHLIYTYDDKRRQLSCNYRIHSSRKEAATNYSEVNHNWSLLRPFDDDGRRMRLFDMCLRFVAHNLDMVESLVGFPAQIGQLLFAESVKFDQLATSTCRSNASIRSRLLLFARAYGDVSDEPLMDSLNITSSFADDSKASRPLLFRFLQPVISLCSLRRLELADSCLGPLLAAHDWSLPHLLASSSHSLAYLGLANNDLDDTWPQKFTLPQRLGCVDFAALACIDLSRNARCRLDRVRLVGGYFAKYAALEQIITSESCIDTVDSECDSLLFRVCTCGSKTQECTLVNSGWCANLCLRTLFDKKQEESVHFASKTEGKYS